MSQPTPTVHVVDDDESFLRAMGRLLSANGFAVRMHPSASAFLSQCGEDAPGCVVSDLHMPGVGGLDLQFELERTGIPLPILFLTGHADTVSTVQAMRRGAEDFLEKRAPTEQLLDAVRRALARDAAQRQARARAVTLAAAFDALTERERQVMQHVLQGRLNKQIAGELEIHERTVKLHRKAVMDKLGVRSVAELTRLAQAAGLLEPLQPGSP
ncbi:MAG TPA: response regulator [Ramlibacter sp.]|nr:response regulator [Ramlibacter sp.]